MTRRFGQADIARDHRGKYLSAEETAQIGGDLSGEGGPLVIHCEEDSLDGEIRIESSADPHQRVKEL